MGAQESLCKVEYRMKLRVVQVSIECPQRRMNQEKNEYDTTTWVHWNCYTLIYQTNWEEREIETEDEDEVEVKVELGEKRESRDRSC